MNHHDIIDRYFQSPGRLEGKYFKNVHIAPGIIDLMCYREKERDWVVLEVKVLMDKKTRP